MATRWGFLPLTLVGSCDYGGNLASFSQQSPYIKAWAPGFNVRCAKPSSAMDMDSGTSVSAAMVGLPHAPTETNVLMNRRLPAWRRISWATALHYLTSAGEKLQSTSMPFFSKRQAGEDQGAESQICFGTCRTGARFSAYWIQ